VDAKLEEGGGQRTMSRAWKLIYNPNALYHSEAYICGEWEGRYGDPFGDHRYGKDEQWKYLRGWFDGQDFRNKRLAVYGRTEKVVTR
jgi:hypothetical protein